MASAARTKPTAEKAASTRRYERRQDATAGPEISAAPCFKAKATPVTYRYDAGLAPALDRDTNPARETASFLLCCIEDAAALPAPHEDGFTLDDVDWAMQSAQRLYQRLSDLNAGISK